jgi:hypothetical protein
MAVATRGPVPKRSNTRRRRNTGSEPTVISSRPTEIPYPADSKWLPSVKRLWESLAQSGMSQFFEPTDWAFGYITLGVLNDALTNTNNTTGQISHAAITGILASLSRLGVTEGDRRRLRIELESEAPEGDPKIAIMADYRRIQRGA